MILTNSTTAEVGTSNVNTIASSTALFRQFMVYAATTISAAITGTTGLIKNGNGTLTLSGSNTYTGATTISGGILAVNNSYSTPSFTINSAAVLNLGYSPTASLTLLGNGTVNIVSVIGAIAPPFTISMGAGGLIDIKSTGGLSYGFGNDPWTGNLADLNVSGVLYIAANNVIVNALTGNSTNFTVGASTIIVGVNNGSGTYTGTLTRNYADASFRKEGSGTQTMNGTINLGATGTITQVGMGNLVINGAILSGSIVQNGTGTLTLTGNNTYIAPTTISAGTLEIGASGQLGSGSYAGNIAINSLTSLFIYSGTNNQTLSGIISGTGALTKNGTGTLTFSGNNTYTGSTTINAGTLKNGTATSVSSGSALTVNGGIFDLNGFNATVASVGVGNAAGTISNSASGSGTNTLTILNYNAAVASLITNGATAKTAIIINNNGGASPISNTNNTFSGGFTIAYGGSGGGSRLYQGSVTNTVVGGILTKSNLGTGTLSIGANGSTSNAQLYLTSGSLYNNVIVNAANYADGGAAAFRLDGTGIQFYGTMTAGSSNINISSQITGSATLNGQLTGTNGLLLKTPAGAGATFTLTLANTLNPSNNYSGNTTTSTRTTIALAAVTQIPNGSGKGNVVNNGTLTLGGLSHTINGLSGSGTIDGVSGTPTLTIGDNNATGSFSGVIQNTAGTLSVTKIGTGSLTLTGVNTYSGATSISDGSIIVPKTNGASTGTATFTNTTLSVSFDVAPTAGMTFRYFPGATTQTYASVTLVNAAGRTGVYISANSTLTIT
jgi:autotransporter-associated beta strand protein